MRIDQLAHSALSHVAQLHLYGSLVAGLVFCIMTAWAYFGLVRTAHRRSRQDLYAAIVSTSGVGLVAVGELVNAFIPLKPHHIASLFVPSMGLGAVLFIGGWVVALVGVCLMPRGEASRWLPVVKEQQNINSTTEPRVWPPAPKR